MVIDKGAGKSAILRLSVDLAVAVNSRLLIVDVSFCTFRNSPNDCIYPLLYEVTICLHKSVGVPSAFSMRFPFGLSRTKISDTAPNNVALLHSRLTRQKEPLRRPPLHLTFAIKVFGHGGVESSCIGVAANLRITLSVPRLTCVLGHPDGQLPLGDFLFL